MPLLLAHLTLLITSNSAFVEKNPSNEAKGMSNSTLQHLLT